MCYSSFKYLWQIYELLEHREYHTNVVVLSNLIKRQYEFLTEEDKIDFANGITSTTEPHQWRLIARMLDAQRMLQVQQRIDTAAVNDRLSLDLKNLEEQPSLRNIKVLVRGKFRLNFLKSLLINFVVCFSDKKFNNNASLQCDTG